MGCLLTWSSLPLPYSLWSSRSDRLARLLLKVLAAEGRFVTNTIAACYALVEEREPWIERVHIKLVLHLLLTLVGESIELDRRICF